jgi:hypothetical protein
MTLGSHLVLDALGVRTEHPALHAQQRAEPGRVVRMLLRERPERFAPLTAVLLRP